MLVSRLIFLLGRGIGEVGVNGDDLLFLRGAQEWPLSVVISEEASLTAFLRP
jgi:hypothetical protein